MAGDDRFRLALDHFGRALGRLDDALARPEDEFMRDAIIQRFEFTFEAGWRAMYRWLRGRGIDLDEDAFSTLPEAFKRSVITDAAAWGAMRKYRNLTSHTYNQALAVEVVAFVRGTGAAALRAALEALEAQTG